MNKDAQRTLLTEFYSRLRTARMNQLYYGERLASTQKLNAALEVLLAIGTSSAVATWALWKTPAGDVAWAVLSGFSTLLAIVKPTLQLHRKIERYGRLFAGHGDVYFDLCQLADEVRRKGVFTREAQHSYRASLERARKLTPEDDPTPSQRRVLKCFEQVKREIPAGSLWLPD